MLEITFPKLNSLNFDSKNIKNVAIFLLNQLEIHFQKFQFWLFYSYFNQKQLETSGNLDACTKQIQNLGGRALSKREQY